MLASVSEIRTLVQKGGRGRERARRTVPRGRRVVILGRGSISSSDSDTGDIPLKKIAPSCSQNPFDQPELTLQLVAGRGGLFPVPTSD